MKKIIAFLSGLLLLMPYLLNAQAPVANFSALIDSSCGPNLNESFQNFSIGNSPLTFKWYFPGAIPDTSTLRNPTNIQYKGYGCYDVKLVVSDKNGSDSLSKNNYVCLDSMPTIIIKGNLNFCRGEQKTDTLIINEDTTYITGVVTGTYTLTIRNGACIKDTSLTIHVDTMPTFVFKADTFLCQGQSTTIYAYNRHNYGYRYLWNTGVTTDSLVTGPLYASQTYYLTISKGACSKDSSEITIKVHTCSMGVENYTDAMQINVFPDPVSNQLLLQTNVPLTKNNLLTITDITGRKVFSELIGENLHGLNIDVSSFYRGIYLLQLPTNQGMVVKKFVKE